ncbi:LacI family DNA-binding transcriptional regulator [uncultured Croceitalea sp.]|uniref:LacI family DNA-binding transcriptional regulator n=1 Tax=uncultured Croceitalea sp. TaxID=1798908 RepID=UPI00374F3DB3
MAGIKDIAKITGLSLATISRVFNESPLVSKKTREIVLKASKKLDYQPNLMASALRSGKSKIIGIIIPELSNPFFSSIINGIEQKANEANYSIIIAQSHESKEKEIKAIQSFIQSKVDGVLLSFTEQTIALNIIKRLNSYNIPVVFFDRTHQLKNTNQIGFDNYKGAFLATEHLINQGCKNIIHIVGNLKMEIHKERKKGYVSALQDYGSFYNEETSIVHLNMNELADSKTIQNLCNDSENPTDGIFAHGDESALYILNILKKIQIDVPKDVKLIGFGNTNFSSLVQPKLSTIDQRNSEMGKLSACMLLEILNSEKLISPKTEILSPKLIIRESSLSQ